MIRLHAVLRRKNCSFINTTVGLSALNIGVLIFCSRLLEFCGIKASKMISSSCNHVLLFLLFCQLYAAIEVSVPLLSSGPVSRGFESLSDLNQFEYANLTSILLLQVFAGSNNLALRQQQCTNPAYGFYP
jgi:hypothetical protein